jgi:predicted aspartyl protease
MGRAELKWNPFDQNDPGPCIKVVVRNSSDVIEAGRAIGLEYPEPHPVTALIDTGASVTIISKTFAKYCKLFQTSEGSELRTLAGQFRCGEHAGTISFPGTTLRSVDSLRIVSADFVRERNIACLIGMDILRNWLITFDGRSKKVIIED